MFRILGQFATRFWPLVLVGWVAALLVVWWAAPRWEDVVDDSEFSYIPQHFDSRRGEALFKQSFSRDLLGSSVVIVLRRESHPEGLLSRDFAFIRDVLKPELEQMQQDVTVSTGDSAARKAEPVITRIRTWDDRAIGELLVSEDGQATLVILELRTELFMVRNHEIIKRIDALLGRGGRLRDTPDELRRVPVGLDVSISGTATVGQDMRIAAQKSASATHLTTVLLVVTLLILIYRAPLLVLIPVATVAVSVTIALDLLAMMGSAGWVRLFTDIEIYIQVVMYGAGVDYCMFLMARYKEELDAGSTLDEALAAAVEKVGTALFASAGTTMAGIGMMVFAQYGKFSQAGAVMAFSLCFVLAAALSLAPAMLRLFGRWAFWPQVRSERIRRAGGWLSPTSLVARLMQSGAFRGVWEKIGEHLRRRPATIWLSTIALMLPFAAVAFWNQNNLSYGLLSELPEDRPSVVGTKAVQQHFPAGATGPVTILLKSDSVRFADDSPQSGFRTRNDEGMRAIRKLTDRLRERRETLAIADVRSIAQPLGITPAADRAEAKWEAELADKSLIEKGARNRRRYDEELAHYVSDKGPLAGYVTRIDIVFQKDPFSRDMLDRLEQTKQTVRNILPEELKEGAGLYFIGPTASMHDLKTVTNQDRIRIYLLATAAVFIVLLSVLRRPGLSAYLIISVLFSYFVSLGATFGVFWMLDPSGFAGLDWKVPVFLFTILIAVGEDYNIYLITRIDEEQKRHGAVEGITRALSKTGGIISGCGLVMAGTFSSLMSGQLVGMQQLGFALAFGVLLDTFVVRPVLVPGWLLMLHRARFGSEPQRPQRSDPERQRRSAVDDRPPATEADRSPRPATDSSGLSDPAETEEPVQSQSTGDGSLHP